jgi:hypothetical protein
MKPLRGSKGPSSGKRCMKTMVLKPYVKKRRPSLGNLIIEGP